MCKITERENRLRLRFQNCRGTQSDEYELWELPNGDSLEIQKLRSKYHIVVRLSSSEKEKEPCSDDSQFDTKKEALEYAWPVYRAVILCKQLDSFLRPLPPDAEVGM